MHWPPFLSWKFFGAKVSEHVGTTDRIAIDHTAEYDYQKLISEEVEEYREIAVTDDLRLGGIHAQKAWQYWFVYLVENVWKTDLLSEIVGYTPPRRLVGARKPLRILSLGCGHGGVELNVARTLGDRPYEIVSVDMNGSLFAEAKARADQEGLRMSWEVTDLNFIQIPEESFDVIYAHASLHHVLNLEHAFQQIARGLTRDGVFIMVEMIGKAEVLFWQENLDAAIELVRTMPDKYKIGVPDPSEVVLPYARPYPGMEGLRQEAIPRAAADALEAVKVFTYGSVVRILCTHHVIGQLLDPDDPGGRHFLHWLFEYDLRMIREGRLRPTEMFGIFKKKSVKSE
jgi:SAM-dependent methyltransferase